MKVYIQYDNENLNAISSVYTSSTNSEAELLDETFRFDKLEGYKVAFDDVGTLTVTFDESKYNAYLEQIKKQQEELEKAQEKEKEKQSLFDLFSITYEASDKSGYQYKIYKLGDTVLKKEYVAIDDSMNDGSDYTKPITYKEAMSVVKGLWYTDGSDVWECIKDGTPTGFDDKEYFDIVE